MRGWLLVNVFLIAIVLIAGGALWLVGFTMWSLGLPPDDHPLVLALGIVAALGTIYGATRWLYRFIGRRV